MNIQILHLIEGAKAARGVTVVIDVFRAMSFEAYLLERGAEKIIPVGDSRLARRLKDENPEFLLAGERHGKILPGFDVGNSPSQLSSVDPSGKTVVHTTSAGTQGIANAIYAETILGGCFLNAKATAQYIRNSGAQEVSLVCMGREALAPSEEDTLCAQYIKSLLENVPMDIRTEVQKLRHTSGAKFFDPAQADVYPRDDFQMCTRTDCFSFVLKLIRPAAGLPYMAAEPVSPAGEQTNRSDPIPK